MSVHTVLCICSDGYDVCYVTIPGRSLGDAQLNAEYVAHNIQDLAYKSSTGRVYVIGHSQGNLNIQWALAYWPSLRNLVSGFGSIAGDFFGRFNFFLILILDRGAEKFSNSRYR